ncbi:MAG: hypothetical protein ACYTKC_19900, partial [Planctomycetota bacterium]
MRQTLTAVLAAIPLATLLATPLCAQKFVDDFNRTGSNALSNWTAQAGTWQIVNNRLRTSGASAWSYIT